MAKNEKPKMVTVASTSTDRKVLLWERDPAHPNGEIFITNNGKPYEVAETDAVKRLIGEDALALVNWNSFTAEKEAPAPTPPGRRRGRQPNLAPELRPATATEENAAGLKGETERESARVSVTPE